MKQVVGVLLILLLAVAAEADRKVPPFPKILMNARYVYVTSYDGDQYDSRLLPEDRQAIASVQDAIQKWGRYTLVYNPAQADMVLMVMSRPSEDVLAVYDGRGWPWSTYLWRVTAQGGLQKGETPLVTDLRKAVEQAASKPAPKR
ncbi:MAG TPA: hypothetical protein VFA89_23180 [Terriglobales bacterium]|nr:hypothetical protein [Terriglobales bacterium]